MGEAIEATSQQFAAHQKLLSQLRVRHLANLFIIASVFVILGTTLYPFDFTTNDFQQRLTPFLAPKLRNLRSIEDDVITNIILFIPIGFSVAILTTRRRIRPIVAMLIVLLAGAGLSLTVEVLQLCLPFRYSSFFDVASNAMGAGVGFLLYRLVARSVYKLLTRAVERGNDGHTTGWLIVTYALYLLCVLMVSSPLQESSLVNNLDKTYPLLLGNEPAGARPWSGSIKNLIITKHELSADGLDEYFSGRDLNIRDNGNVLAHYEFAGAAPYDDMTKNHSALVWKGTDTAHSPSNYAHITPQRWLQTHETANFLSSWIMVTTRFTICITAAATAGFRPSWKARIVSVLADPYHQNISLVQIDDDLCVRFRSMTTGVNGTNPQFIVPDVFADTLMHRIVVSLNSTHLHVYVDSVQRHYELELGPGFALLNRFFPSNGSLDISSRMKDFHTYLFDVLVFMPLAYVLGLMVRQLQTGILLQILAACIGVAAPPFLLEKVLTHSIGRPLNTESLLLGITLMAGTMALTLISHATKPKTLSLPQASSD